MAEIDPRLSGPLCTAFELALSRERRVPLSCRDVSRESPPQVWDLELLDARGDVVLRVSHTRSIWREATKAMAEIEDIRETIECQLHALEIPDLLVSLHFQELPTSKPGRREFAESLVSYVLAAHTGLIAAAGDREVDILDQLEADEDPRWLELRTKLNSFDVCRMPLDGSAIVHVGDIRMARFMPTATEGVIQRHAAKAERHAGGASQLGLLVEVEDAELSPKVVQLIRLGIGQQERQFRSLHVCCRDHSTRYRVLRVY